MPTILAKRVPRHLENVPAKISHPSRSTCPVQIGNPENSCIVADIWWLVLIVQFVCRRKQNLCTCCAFPLKRGDVAVSLDGFASNALYALPSNPFLRLGHLLVYTRYQVGLSCVNSTICDGEVQRPFSEMLACDILLYIYAEV